MRRVELANETDFPHTVIGSCYVFNTGLSHAANTTQPPRVATVAEHRNTIRTPRTMPGADKGAVMALADIAKQPKTDTAPWRTCQICHLLTQLDKAEAGALNKMLADDGWRYTEIHQALDHEGYKVDYSSIRRHVRGGCGAGKRLR